MMMEEDHLKDVEDDEEVFIISENESGHEL
jgi:hypothetical protein